MSEAEGKWKELTGGMDSISKFVKPSEMETVEGVFEGILPGEYGDSYKIRLADGNLIAVNACKALKDTLPSLETGSEVRLVNAGKKKLKNGNTFNDIKVYVA